MTIMLFLWCLDNSHLGARLSAEKQAQHSLLQGAAWDIDIVLNHSKHGAVRSFVQRMEGSFTAVLFDADVF